MRDIEVFCIFTLIYMQLTWMVFNKLVKALYGQSKRSHYVEVMNDWTILITTYLMLLFTEMIHEPQVRYNVGWALAGVQGIAILVSLSLALYDTIVAVRASCSEFKARRARQKEMKNSKLAPIKVKPKSREIAL